MTVHVGILALACMLAAALAAAALGILLATTPAAPRPILGHRGAMRRLALGGAFALVEPPMRAVAGYVALLPLTGARARIAPLVVHAGDHLGLDADDCIALAVLGSTAFGASAAAFTRYAGLGASWVAGAIALGAALPFMALRERRTVRERQIARRLPSAIDLAALCMGAGLDFAGAIEVIVREAEGAQDHLAQELRRVLQELSMGRTRREALLSFAERVPAPAARDFVNAVVQAEDKGNPLVDVLRVQAHVSRTQRSVAGEEAAARAAVLLALPLVLLLASILLVMLGPFLVHGMGLQ
jgi:tight adherence protein C